MVGPGYPGASFSTLNLARGTRPLHNAAMFGIPNVVQRLLSEGADPCAQTPEGYTPLHVAVEANDKDTVGLLLAAGAKLSQANFIINQGQVSKGNNWVTWTANQEAPVVKGVATNFGRGRTANPVNLAAMLGRGELLEILLNSTTSMDMVGEALRSATECRQEQVVAQILTKFPSIDHRHVGFTRALFTAASNADTQAIFRIFLALRPDINDANGILTALLPIVCTHLPEQAVEILNKGAKLDGSPVYSGDEIPLQAAITTRNVPLAKFLIGKGADISLRLQHYTSGIDRNMPHKFLTNVIALQMAAANGLESIVELLLDLGADIEHEGDWMTPLTIAAYYGQEEVVKLLLKRKANVEGSKNSPLRPLMACARDGGERVDVAKILVEHEADINADRGHGSPLQHAVDLGYQNLTRLLLENGAAVNHRRASVQEGCSRTPLDLAVASGRQDMCHLLLSHGADPNSVQWDSDDQTIFMDACAHNSFVGTSMEIVSTCLDFGADINAQDTDGWSPLEIAVEAQNAPLCQLLLEKGAVPTERILSNSELSMALQDMRILSCVTAARASEDEIHDAIATFGLKRFLLFTCRE